MVQPKTYVAIIDGDKKLHQTYNCYFDNKKQLQLTGIYSTIEEALLTFDKRPPDIVVSELQLKGINGITGITQLRKNNSSLKVIILSNKSDFNIIKRVFREGANGFLTKPLTKNRFYNALESVKNDGTALTYDVAKKVVSIFQKRKYEWLSDRENQIVEHLSEGATYKSIAQKLFVSPSTVSFHIQNIYLKLNVNSKSEALEKLKQLEEFGKAS
jgi:DNA-binding NarL/FixJ family response regulator